MLTDQDKGELLAALARIGRAEGVVDFARRTCEELLRLVPGLSTSYNEINIAAQRAAVVVHPDPGRESFDHFGGIYERYMHESPFVAYWLHNERDEVIAWTDIDPQRTFESTTLFREFYLPLGVRSQLAFLLPAPPGITIALAVNRDGTGFDARERALAAALRGHLVYLYRLVSHAEASRQRSAELADDGWSAVLVDDDGTVLESNDLAVSIGKAAAIDLTLGAGLAGGVLWSAVAGSRVDLWAGSHTQAPVNLPTQRVPFEARLVRSGVGPHLLWIREPVRVTLEDALALGLTARQAQIGVLLVDGLTNDQIARRLGIARGTVRKHLEQAFKRLGVPSRAAAVGKLQARARRDP